MRVKIPFYERFRDPLLNGTKTWTSRTRRYGKPDDVFLAFGASFKILSITKKPLSEVADHWREEGCTSIEDFIVLWKKIHYRVGFLPKQMVYVHTFILDHRRQET